MRTQSISDRREFLKKTLSSCAFCCLGTAGILGADNSIKNSSLQEHKFDSDSGWSIQKVFNFTFKSWYIPVMRNLMKQVGKEELIDMVKNSSEMLYEIDNESDIDYSKQTLSAWSSALKSGMKTIEDYVTYEIITDNENLFEVKFTECLWAKTFREAEAPEIGYAGVCHQDYAIVKQFNPNLKLIREKTQMHGDDCCHFKYIKEA